MFNKDRIEISHGEWTTGMIERNGGQTTMSMVSPEMLAELLGPRWECIDMPSDNGRQNMLFLRKGK